MNYKSTYIVVLGVISLTGILSAAFASKLDGNTTVITGVLVVAGVAVGALATLAREIHEEQQDTLQWPAVRPYQTPPSAIPSEPGWPAPRDFQEEPTKPRDSVE
jgi:hypothetical protein